MLTVVSPADVMGMIVDYEHKSFVKFVCRLALEPDADPNTPGQFHAALEEKDASAVLLSGNGRLVWTGF